MLAFAIRRLFEALMVMLAVALIAFSLFRYVGDPVNQMVGQDATLEDRAALRHHLGLDDPVLVQFGRFIAHAAEFDFGISYQLKQPVSGLIAERFPATFELARGGGAVCGRPRHPDGRSTPASIATAGCPRYF